MSPVRLFTKVSLARIVPDRTFMNETVVDAAHAGPVKHRLGQGGPRKSSTRVLNTRATGEPAASMVTSTGSPLRTASAGPTSAGAGPTRQMK